jgi:AI-2 transport protein TqsA
MKDNSQLTGLPILQGAACIVIVLWGVRASSDVLGPALLGLLLAYAVAPFPKWLMQRFKLSKTGATGFTALALAVAGLSASLALEFGVMRLATRLPIYEQRLADLYEHVMVFLSAHGVESTSLSVKNVLTAERLSTITASVLPAAGAIVVKGSLIVLLAFLLITEMLPDTGGKLGSAGQALTRHGEAW